MSNPIVRPCSAMLLLFLVACGGDKPAASPTTPPANPAPAKAPAPAPAPTPTAPAADLQKAPDPAVPAQDPAAKPLPRVRIDVATVKTLFGKDPTAEEVDNPGTPEKVALGNALYHDKHLSPDGAVSCATCHPLGTYGVDGNPVSGERNAPTTWNSFRQFRQSWDGRAATVEELALTHALEPAGNGLADEARLVAKIKEKAELVAGFGKAFPGGGEPVTAANFRLAMGAFLRTLVTKSKFDAWLDGDPKALGTDELYGLKAFIDTGCITCHTTRLVGGHMFQKTGLLKAYGSKDEGRMKLTRSDADKHFFKVPSLVNVEKTAPYLHDGKAKTLEEVVTVMADIQLDKKLTPDQLRGIVAFLKSLTGPLPPEQAAAK